MKSRQYFILIKDISQKISDKCFPSLDINLIRLISKKLKISQSELNKQIKEYKSITIKTVKRIEQQIRLAIAKEYNLKPSFINQLFDRPTKSIIDHVINTNNELLCMILATKIKSNQILNELAQKFRNSWQVNYQIALNVNSNAETLNNITHPVYYKNKQMKKMYNGPIWRNIRLYVVRNPNVSKKTLNWISKFESYWGMDRDEAKIKLTKLKCQIIFE